MKKCLTIVLVFAILLTGCAAPAAPAQTPSQSVIEPSAPAVSSLEKSEPLPVATPEQMALSPRLSDPTDLDLARMEEDFDYLWQAMERGYPFLGVARRSGVDVDGVRQRYRAGLADLSSHAEFAQHLEKMVDEFRFIGHFEFLGSAGTYLDYCSVYDNPTAGYHSGLLAATLRGERTVAAYRSLAQSEGISGFDPDAKPLWNGGGTGQSGGSGNITTRIVEQGRIAYLQIRSFGGSFLETDYEALLRFYGEVADYDHLIIDITGNGGGSDDYWRRGIVQPNLKEAVSAQQILLFNGAAPENQAYLALTAGTQRVQPIAELPTLPALNAADRATMDSFYIGELTMSPAADGALFGGQIWVLVGPTVYSASESFALFCQSSGFATLVGENTGGDGGGWDPSFVVLPHSGLLARYSVFYTLNPDGSNNEEYGTRPDVPSQPGESALDACLRAIRAA